MPPRAKIGKKVKVGVSLDPSLHAWAMERVGPGKQFSTLTHAIERGLALLGERERVSVPLVDGDVASSDTRPSSALRLR